MEENNQAERAEQPHEEIRLRERGEDEPGGEEEGGHVHARGHASHEAVLEELHERMRGRAAAAELAPKLPDRAGERNFLGRFVLHGFSLSAWAARKAGAGAGTAPFRQSCRFTKYTAPMMQKKAQR